VRFIGEQGSLAKVRPDMRIVFIRDFDTAEQRLKGTSAILRSLAGIAEKKKAA
jgi:transcription-repair coupling factor (superfamily II helicase)